jgi:hypothetical protein
MGAVTGRTTFDITTFVPLINILSKLKTGYHTIPLSEPIRAYPILTLKTAANQRNPFHEIVRIDVGPGSVPVNQFIPS